MALDPEQLLDLQGDLAIGADESVFTDDELERFYTRADSDYNTAVYYGWRQILAASAKWVDYQVAQTKVSRSQAFKQIRDMVEFWGNESRTNANQVRVLGLNGVPTRYKPRPESDHNPPRDRRDVRLYDAYD